MTDVCVTTKGRSISDTWHTLVRFLLSTAILLGWGNPLMAGGFPDHPEPVVHLPITFFGRTLYQADGTWTEVIIPLKRAGRLFLLEAKIDHVVGNFILDTGSSELVLNKTYFRDYMVVDEEEWSGASGATGTVCRTRVKSLQLSELEYTGFYADVVDLGHIENRRGVKVLGLFGMSLLREVELVLDVRKLELHIYRLDKKGTRVVPQTKQVDFDITASLSEFHNILFLKANVGEKNLTFCLDTGAESNVLSTGCSKKVLSTVTITRRSGLYGAGGSGNEVLYGSMNDFNIGDQPMQAMNTILTSLDGLSQKYGMPIDGVLGFEFFDHGQIYINLITKQLGICLYPVKKS